MTESEVEEFQDRLAALTEDFFSDRPKKPGQRHYRALFATYQPPAELRDLGSPSAS
jgi:hypothetical protein